MQRIQRDVFRLFKPFNNYAKKGYFCKHKLRLTCREGPKDSHKRHKRHKGGRRSVIPRQTVPHAPCRYEILRCAQYDRKQEACGRVAAVVGGGGGGGGVLFLWWIKGLSETKLHEQQGCVHTNNGMGYSGLLY